MTKFSFKKVLYVILFLIFVMALSVGGCNGGTERGSTGFIPTATFTNTLTPSPTHCPVIDLPTLPSEVTPLPTTLWVIVFNPDFLNEIWRLDEQKEPVDLQVLLRELLEAWVNPADRIIIIQTGCRYWDSSCWLCHNVLPTPLPNTYHVPPTPTPIPTLAYPPTPTLHQNASLFKKTQVARWVTATAAFIAPTNTYMATLNRCAVEEWKKQYHDMYQVYQATQQVFESELNSRVIQTLNSCWTKPDSVGATPYTPQGTLLDALYQVSIVLNQERGHYDRNRVLVFDYPKDWRVQAGNDVHDLSFDLDLSTAEVWLFLPKCRETYDPLSCKELVETWRDVLHTYARPKAIRVLPNSRLMERFGEIFSDNQGK